MELIEEAESEKRKVIIFSFFLDTIRKVVQLLGDRCMNPINGSVSPQRRQEIIDDFDKAPAGAVLAVGRDRSEYSICQCDYFVRTAA